MRAPWVAVLAAALVAVPGLAANFDAATIAGATPASALLAIDQHRTTVVDRVVGRFGDALEAAEGGLSREQLRTMLESLRADHLLAASLAGNLEGLRNVLANAITSTAPVQQGLVAAKALGDPNADLTYTPVAPCRIVDTRAAGGALVANVARTFVGFSANFSTQGGTASSCGMPNGVAAIAMNVYAVNPTTLGFIKTWAGNGVEPAVSTINYQAGITALANGAIVPVDAATNNQFKAKSPAPVDFIADVVGYFRAPTGFGTVTAVTASSPLSSSGGTMPNISLAGAVPVSNGGTGQTSLTSGAVLFGNGTGGIVPGSGASGQVLANKGGGPLFTSSPFVTSLGIGTSTPSAPLGFPPTLGKKITLYPGIPGDYGFSIQPSRFEIHADSATADIALGWLSGASFVERFAVKASGALAVASDTGASGSVLTSNGPSAAAAWVPPSSLLHTQFNDASDDCPTLSTDIDCAFAFTYSVNAATNARIVISATVTVTGVVCPFCGNAFDLFNVRVDGSILKQYVIAAPSGVAVWVPVTNIMFDVAPGAHVVSFDIDHDGADTASFARVWTSSIMVLPR